ncbi:MAG: carboxypeptidase regulatory-like domain-containing protein [Ruminococcaceae bacterium]|nr:carboxypeptidase regulatory-like domain-containing protein [Oscillospiraceae bacterium]
MKKFLTRVIALALVSLMFAMPCMAATYSSVTYEGDTITVSLDGYNQGDESTVIIVKSGVDLATVSDSEIVNIDQKPVVSADGKVSFALPVDERAQEIGVKAVDIYIGGSSMDDAEKYAETITLNEQADIKYVYTASFKTSLDGKFGSAAEAKADVQVMKTKYVDGVETSTEDVTSSCRIEENNGVFDVYLDSNKVTSIAFTVANITYKYAASFKSGKTTFTTDAEAKADVIVKKIKYENGVATGEEQDVTTMATIVVNNGVISVAILEADFSATLNYSLATLGISGIINWTDIEAPLENALVYLYDGETLKGVTLTDANGSYSFSVGAGTYQLYVSGSYVEPSENYVYQMAPAYAEVTVTDRVATQSFDLALPLDGDLTGDGKVDKSDVSLLKAMFTN